MDRRRHRFRETSTLPGKIGFSTSLRAQFQHANHPAHGARIVSLSRGGACIGYRHHLRTGDRLRLLIIIGARRIESECAVMWRKKQANSTLYGLSFESMEPDDEVWLHTFIMDKVALQMAADAAHDDLDDMGLSE